MSGGWRIIDLIAMEILRRDTIRFPMGLLGIEPHLHVVLCDPFSNPLIEGGRETVVLVSISTYEAPPNRLNSVCVLQPGDHPFIKHASYVCYHLARQMAVKDIQNNLQSGLYQRKEPISEEVFQKIYQEFNPSTAKDYILIGLGLLKP